MADQLRFQALSHSNIPDKHPGFSPDTRSQIILVSAPGTAHTFDGLPSNEGRALPCNIPVIIKELRRQ